MSAWFIMMTSAAALPPFLSFLAAIIARRPPERPRARHCGPAPAWTAA